ncbi:MULTISPECIES: hypothetical protein [Gimesia]|jgi:hypothetical protein|uniref:Uncharacterized protein n=2 Tax=Gimesia TaxID=1649453 RepID=A0A6I6AFM7_9PLAN|nr:MULTISPECIES: hypothetical protein [Gimesia]KAA0140927.1 hypothetical protein FYZ48_06550 [Gimesia chilikensis]QDT88030.1 hypothetical protein MalM14_57250 [Gimesia chilikensis]QDU06306.1 hypothetical protein V6x_60580 [Gimesia chilikensis]QGQ24075.1 hypothetical protein F1728_15875 [Gimesia benthica]
MSTPFEELEYLADFLPEEGESVIVSRNHGELVCENFQKERPLDEMASPEFYGHLVHANERLNALVARPVWIALLTWFWACVLIHRQMELSWDGWYLDLGLGLVAMAVCYAAIRFRQDRYFKDEVRPTLNRQMYGSNLSKYALVGVIRQRPELRTLLDTLSRSLN